MRLAALVGAPRAPRALRWRIAGLVTAAICAVAVAVGVLVHQASRDRELSQARDVARTTLDRAAVGYARTGDIRGSGAMLDPRGLPAELRTLVREGHEGTQFSDGSAAAGKSEEPAGRTAHAEGGGDGGGDGPAMWAARPAGRRVLAVRVDMTVTMRNLGALDTNIVLAGLLTTAVVLPLGVLTAGRMSRRLRAAAGTARRIAAGDLDARISAGSAPARPYDEIAEISGAVDTMAAALQERLRSEQRFTADVAHELRTPLMGLVTAAELLPEGKAAEYVRDRVRALSTLIEDLLEISRLDAGAEQAQASPCSVAALIEDAVQRTGLSVELVAHGTGAKVWTDPRRLERIVANLVVNAHQHGKPPVLAKVAPGGTTVTVRDSGPGYPADLLGSGPQRFRTGARERGRGHGLGLTIALGQAEVIGATLDFGNAADGGAVATLRLPDRREPAELPADSGELDKSGPIHG
ncbi:sensor histidine kinase [Streptomyces winkii]|uniref:sensor histidine kinase n=1 Tax=Streptomyces winkii TaxID=3051178 RepID=UPI0028D67ECB|nr:HAMP domain-containing sensor histidine kinase [Streptomyces sp. DSM 40971]